MKKRLLCHRAFHHHFCWWLLFLLLLLVLRLQSGMADEDDETDSANDSHFLYDKHAEPVQDYHGV